MKITTRQLVESALMIAVGTALSLFTFSGPWALGGGITVCSMLPLVLLSHRYGTRAGVFASLVYGGLQMLLGFSNVQYATNFFMAVGIALLDYVLAYAMIGLSAVFDKKLSNRLLSIALGIVFSFSLRFLCHFISGWWIWEALWPNELSWASPVWSLAYNMSYMAPEMAITIAASVLLYRPLKPYWMGADIR